MKKILVFAITIIIIFSSMILSSCQNGAKQYDGEVNVYNWGEYISVGEDGRLNVIEEFEKRYNIKVNYTNFETNEELYNVLKNSNAQYDVIIPSDYMIARLIEENMLEEIDFSNIPNYKYISNSYKNMPYDPENKYTVPYSAGVVGIVYNKTMVNPDDIKDFDCLWNPKYKGKILMFNNSRDASAIAMQLCNPPIDPGKKKFTYEEIDRAMDKLIQQKPVLKKYVMDQVFNEMENNQSAIATYYAGDIFTMMENNPNLDYCLPESGSDWFVDAMCIPTCCQNKDNAELFINFMNEPEIARDNIDYIGYTTPNTEAYKLLDDDIKNSKLIYPDDSYLKKCYTFNNMDVDSYNYLQKQFVKACSASAEVSEIDTSSQGSSIISKIIVAALIALVLIMIIIILILDIIKAVKNRGKINK